MSDQPIPGRCGYPKREGGYCEKFPLIGKDRCRKHRALAGRPKVHGRRSRFGLIFRERWENYLADPDLKQFEADYALCLAREEELSKRLEADDSPEWRKEAMELMASLRAAVRDNKPPRVQASLNALDSHLNAGADRDAAWEALLQNSERRAALLKTATAAQHNTTNSFTPAEVLQLMTAMLDLIRGDLGDGTAARFAERFEVEILGTTPQGRREPLALDAGGTIIDA